MTIDPVHRAPVILHGPIQQRLVAGRHVYYAPGVPVLEPDAPRYDVPAQPRPGELGAIEFVRDLARWLARLFDQPLHQVIYRENPWDHRPCPRAAQADITIAGHEIAVVTYDTHHSGLTQYALTVDARPVPFAYRRLMRNLPWHLAVTVWRAACDPSQDRPGTTPGEPFTLE